MRKLTIKATIVVVALAIIVGFVYIKLGKSSKSNDIDYAVVNTPTNIDVGGKRFNPKEVSEIVNDSDLIIEGEIGESQDYTYNLSMDIGVAMGQVNSIDNDPTSVKMDGTKVRVKVLSQIKGNSSSEYITLIQAGMDKPLMPVFKTGDHVVLMLAKGSDNSNEYYPVHSTASYFLVVDNKVYSYYKDSDDFKNLKGTKLKQFISKIEHVKD